MKGGVEGDWGVLSGRNGGVGDRVRGEWGVEEVMEEAEEAVVVVLLVSV